MPFFTIPTFAPQTAAEALNAFLAAPRVVHVERHFGVEEANSEWSICVSYMEGEGRLTADKLRPQLVVAEYPIPVDRRKEVL